MLEIVFIATVISSSQPLLKPLTAGATIESIEPEKPLFHNYGDGKIVLRRRPGPLAGLPAIKARDPYQPQSFELAEPARAFWAFYPRVYTSLPADWKVFRQRALVTSLDASGDRFPSDVYYKDLPAGRHQVANPPNRLVCLGFKTPARMTPADCVLNPLTADPSGVYRPGAEVVLTALVDNPTAAHLSGQIRWQLAGRAESGQIGVSLPARQESRVRLALPTLAAGFYVLAVELRLEGGSVDARRFPVAVIEPPKPDATVGDPFFPVGGYNKFFLSHDPQIARIYMHGICASLRAHHMNTYVGPALDNLREELEIAKFYGIRVLVRLEPEIPQWAYDHPAVLAYMFGDEPAAKDVDRYKARYEEFRRRHPARPLVTAMVGERVGTLTEDDPVRLWQVLGSEVRLARFYPFRKVQYDLLRHPVYKKMLPVATAFDLFDGTSDKPWWYVIQGFGGRPTAERPDPYWRNPTPAELTALGHLSLAYGARAILSWPLQTHGPEPSSGVALIAQETLTDEDGKYAALAGLAAQIAEAKPVLLRHRRAAIDVSCDVPAVLPVPREDPQTGRKYVYLVNLDAARAQTGRLTIVPGKDTKFSSAVDVYCGGRLELTSQGKLLVAPVRLGPGSGQLWELK